MKDSHLPNLNLFSRSFKSSSPSDAATAPSFPPNLGTSFTFSTEPFIQTIPDFTPYTIPSYLPTSPSEVAREHARLLQEKFVIEAKEAERLEAARVAYETREHQRFLKDQKELEIAKEVVRAEEVKLENKSWEEESKSKDIVVQLLEEYQERRRKRELEEELDFQNTRSEQLKEEGKLEDKLMGFENAYKDAVKKTWEDFERKRAEREDEQSKDYLKTKDWDLREQEKFGGILRELEERLRTLENLNDTWIGEDSGGEKERENGGWEEGLEHPQRLERPEGIRFSTENFNLPDSDPYFGTGLKEDWEEKLAREEEIVRQLQGNVRRAKEENQHRLAEGLRLHSEREERRRRWPHVRDEEGKGWKSNGLESEREELQQSEELRRKQVEEEVKRRREEVARLQAEKEERERQAAYAQRELERHQKSWRDLYASTWVKLQKLLDVKTRSTSSESDPKLSFKEFAWPLFPSSLDKCRQPCWPTEEDISSKALGEFLLSHLKEEEKKGVVREAMRAYHPDRFERLVEKMGEGEEGAEERDKVRKLGLRVTQVLSGLMK